jgi:heat shock protein HtpX
LLGFGAVAGSYYAGDSAVLAATNAKPADPAHDQELINVVTELSLAAGIPTPKIYVIPDTALNAFATGRDRNHASIAVTRGILEKLDREQLQGVVGHELSHVRNLDIRYALLIAALVGAIVLLADIFLHSLRYWRPKGKNGAAALLIVLILAIFFAILAPIFARLVQMAASRQREYLADASSVELTRNPVGIERALLEVGKDREVLEVANRATQHLFFTNPIHRFEKRAKGLFSTHPSIPDRVDRLRTLRGAAPLDAATAAAYEQ